MSIKSTVLPGTARKVSEFSEMNVSSIPEFTREGSAVRDTKNSDRSVISGKYVRNVEQKWEFIGSPVVVTTTENAELIKYANNAFLAVKIFFINKIADLCEKNPGKDVNMVAECMGIDRKIGREFLKAGLGYGGSCFPKDTAASSSFAEEEEADLTIVKSAIYYNESGVASHVIKIKENLDTPNGKKICVLGLSFKDNADDLRESRSLMIIENLRNQGDIVSAYDPVVRNIGNIDLFNDLSKCIPAPEIVITATKSKDFSDISPSLLRGKKVFDLRRIFDPKQVELTMGDGLGKN